ncbi:MAG: group II intron reverse transcriptase/maturase [Patescibacteria group bacterium]|nr:group II intron reverse transcriptase/maturase [Patescibacteria group bacterium]
MTQHPTGGKKNMSLSAQTLRIRTRAREWSQSGRKHWDLYRYLSDPYLLHDALKLVMANRGAAGLDGQTVKEIRGQEWEFCRHLACELKKGTYRPSAVRRVYIPKSAGGERPLGIPTLRDRTVQRALCLLLETIYEPKFHEFSFGFRPGKRAVDCVAQVAKTVDTHRYVLEADIAQFFNRVSHNKTLALLSQEIVDKRIVRLISRFLKAGFVEPGKPWQPSLEGTPQGGPLSPLLANIYLHYFLDTKFVEMFGTSARVKMFRYADDFVMVATTRQDLSALYRCLGGWMREAGLSLKAEKTRAVDMTNRSRSHTSKFDFLGFKIHLRAYRDNPKRFWIARQPSERSRLNLRTALRVRMQAHLSVKEVSARMRATWIGWCNYFSQGNSNRVFYRERDSVRRLIGRYLRRKFRRTRKPVSWRRLCALAEQMMREIRPVRVQNSRSGERQTAFRFGGA